MQDAQETRGSDLFTDKVLHWIATVANSTTHSSSRTTPALFLDAPFVPVFRFREKLDSFLSQVNSSTPNFDIAFLGTCPGEELNVKWEDRVSRNVYRSRASRCFTALLLSQKGAQKIMSHEPPSKGPRLGIQALLTALIETVPLEAVWAVEPLIYDETQLPHHSFLCPDKVPLTDTTQTVESAIVTTTPVTTRAEASAAVSTAV